MSELLALVTGGSGYLGSVLVPYLLGEGYRVRVLDNFRHRQPSLLAHCLDDRLEIVRGDVRATNPPSAKPLKGVSWVIPLAAVVGAAGMRSRRHSGHFHERQTPSASSSASAAPTSESCSPSRTAVTGSARRARSVPKSPRSGRSPCTGERRSRPRRSYSTPEKPCRSVWRRPLERPRECRSGPARERLHPYRAVTDRVVVLFEAHFKRNYIHVQDISRVFAHGMRHFAAMKSRPYNVGLSDANLSKLELCEVIRSEVPGFQFLLAEVGEDPDKRDYIVSNERLEGTGFRPQVGLRQGIRELVKAYRTLPASAYTNL